MERLKSEYKGTGEELGQWKCPVSWMGCWLDGYKHLSKFIQLYTFRNCCIFLYKSESLDELIFLNYLGRLRMAGESEKFSIRRTQPASDGLKTGKGGLEPRNVASSRCWKGKETEPPGRASSGTPSFQTSKCPLEHLTSRMVRWEICVVWSH